MTDNLRALITKDNLILAGTKVRDKSGGPLMVIVCFYTDGNLVYNQKFKSKGFLLQKVFVNKQRKTIRELSDGSVNNDKTYTYFLFRDIFSEVEIKYGSPSEQLYIICKYWSDMENDFIYVNKTLAEIEAI